MATVRKCDVCGAVEGQDTTDIHPNERLLRFVDDKHEPLRIMVEGSRYAVPAIRVPMHQDMCVSCIKLALNEAFKHGQLVIWS